MPESFVMVRDKICKNSVRYTIDIGAQPFSVYIPKAVLTDPPKRRIELTLEELPN